MSQSLITQIESLVASGKHRQAYKLMRKLVGEKLSPTIRFHLSTWYHRMGKPESAIKILGAEMMSLVAADTETIRLQLRLAYMLSYFDAPKSADRIFKRLAPIISKSSVETGLLASYNNYLAEHFLRVYDYRSALTYFEAALKLRDPKKETFAYALNRLGIADSFDGLGDQERAISIATEVIESLPAEFMILKGSSLTARGEYYLRSDNFKKAREDFETAFQLFPSVKSRDFAYLAKWSGVLHLKDGNRKDAARDLATAYRVLKTDRIGPMSLLEVLYWQFTMKGRKEWQEPFRVVATHPCQSPYAFLAGRTLVEQNLFPWLRRQIPQMEFADTWVLNNRKLSRHIYATEIHDMEEASLVIDLVSGIIKTRHKISLLSPLKAKALLFLAAAGIIGINDWALIERLYSEEDYIPNSLVLRLNELIKVLRKEGFKINRTNNQFQWTPSKHAKVIWPMDLEFKGIQEHVQVHFKSFKRQDIEAYYGISPATAKIWITEWLERGLQKTGVGKATRYTF